MSRYRNDGDSHYLRLSQRIAENNLLLQEHNDDLRRIIRVIGTDREEKETASVVRELCDGAHSLIRETNDMISQMSHLDGGGPQDSRARKYEQEKLALELEQGVKEFRQLQSEAVRKEKESIARDRASSIGYSDNEDAPLVGGQQSQMQLDVRSQAQYIQEREEAIREMESTMVEINDIFKDLSTMVHDQGQVLDNIAASVYTGSAQVEEGVGQLTSANKYQKRSRNKMMCIMVIFVIVAAILAIILATTIKK